jgi:hypothetical protein
MPGSFRRLSGSSSIPAPESELKIEDCRLNSEGVVCAEGYLFEMERRGYLTSGEFVPEVALENPDALKILHHA